MIGIAASAEDKRRALRAGLKSGRLLRYVGAFSPIVAKLVADIGFDGVYVSGAGLSADRALPDIGLITQTEAALRGGQIAEATALPAIIDADTGYGEAVNVVRTIDELERAGLSGCHLEDQINPKRCGHLDNKQLVETGQMVEKIRAAVGSRRDPNFLIMARTDARSVEGLDAAIERAKAYEAAGADMIFPEAPWSEDEFAAFRAAIKVPLLANMTEFGKSPLLSTTQLGSLGYEMVIYPVTTLRLAMHAVEDGLKALKSAEDQSGLVDRMQTRTRLYELLRYQDYASLDASVAGYGVGKDSAD